MKHNPYIGPRPYERQDFHNFYGRAREARDLLSLILANRVVLFYAQSGAGKTSLLNAQIIPDLEARGFNVLPVARVGSDAPPGIAPPSVQNIFVFSVLMGLVANKEIPAGELTHETLFRFLRERKLMDVIVASQAQDQDSTLLVTGNHHPPMLILDQFEEILTTHRDRWQDAQGFFEQLGEALRGLPELGVVLAMREDHVAGLDPYAALLPKRLKVRYRMERLTVEGALEAVAKPALRAGAPFAPGVAERLVDDLRRIKVHASPAEDGSLRGVEDEGSVLGPYVEPVQLQVVCNRLWENLPDDLGHDIGWEEVERYGNIDRALTEFYESAVTQVVNLAKVSSQGRSVNEHQLREWFGQHMITPAQTRGLALRGEHETAGLPNESVDILESQHLIRADARGGTFWYELVHDRLIEPILQSNREWEAARQTPLLMTAKHWCETKSEGLLYRDKALKDGLAWVQAHPDEVESCETEFLQASQQAERSRLRRRRLYVTGAMVSAAVLIVMIVLTVFAVQGRQAAQAAQAIAEAHRIQAVTAQANAETRRQEAVTAQAEAETRRQVAVTAQAEALAQRSIAVTERSRAEQQARIAFARELAAQALRSAAEKQTDLGLLLSLEANRIANAVWARDNLLEVLQTNPSLITHLHGHTDSVWSVAFSPDDRLLASASADRTIRLWDVATRQPLGQPLTGHTGEVYSVAFSPDGKVLASASADKTIRLWDVATRQPLGQALIGHTDSVNSLAFSPDGETLASGSLDKTIRLWDVATGKPLGQPLTGHTGEVYSVAFSPDGKVLASGSSDATVRLWNVATGKPLGPAQGRLTGHKGSVWSVAFSSDGLVLASGSADATIHLWDVETGEPMWQPLTGHRGPVWSVAFLADSWVLASGSSDATVRLWDVETGRPLDQPITSPSGQVNSVAFSSDGETLASGGKDGIIRLWDVAAGQSLGPASGRLTGPTGHVTSVAFSPDGKILASGSDGDPAVILWDVAAGKPIGQPITGTGQASSVAFSPDGKMLASGSADGSIRLWDVATGMPLGQPITGTGQVNNVVFSRDGKTLVSGDGGGTIRLWDVSTALNTGVATRQSISQPITGSTGHVTSVAFSPDGKTLALGSDGDSSVILWDVATGKPVGPAQGRLTGHKGPVRSVAFSPDGKVLASGSSDATVRLWDVSTALNTGVATGMPLGQPLTGHTDWVNSVAFSRDGNTLASAGRDGTIRLWDVAARQPIGPPLTGPAGHVTSIAFSPDGKTLASGGDGDPAIILWDVDPESWQARACRIANRNLTPAEWKQYFGDKPDEPYRKTCEQWLIEPTPTPTATPGPVAPPSRPTAMPTPTPTPTAPATPTPTARATSTPATNVIGPIGSGALKAVWTGAGNCAMQEKQDASGARSWWWEADFYIEVRGGSAGYTINSAQCRWDFSLQKYVCRWGVREDGVVLQNVTVSCPSCKPDTLAIYQIASRGRGNVCELK